jgi:hypothetical protein
MHIDQLNPASAVRGEASLEHQSRIPVRGVRVAAGAARKPRRCTDGSAPHAAPDTCPLF